MTAIDFRGHDFSVPRSWPVYNLTAHPSTCVRFDVHAVYIGTPSARENCPAQGVARPTESLLIQPGGTSSTEATQDTVDQMIYATAPGVSVTAAYGTNPATVLGIFSSAHWPKPRPYRPRPVGTRPVRTWPAPTPTQPVHAMPIQTLGPIQSSTPSASIGPTHSAQPTPSVSTSPSAPVKPSPTYAAPSSAPPSATAPGSPIPPTPGPTPTPPPGGTGGLVAATTVDTGLGFDACTAPSGAQMQTWAADSPFNAVGIYVGGSERACAQPNLTASWVAAQAVAGWHFFPIYAGWQAAWDSLTATAPATLGTQGADDAVKQAQSLGFGPGSLIYYDMEAYSTSAEGTAAMAFLSAWTSELHVYGYRSAVYSSASSAISNLVAHQGKITEPDAVDIAHWNGVADSAPGDTPAADWPGNRVHQYLGGAKSTYGGVTINIDQDYLALSGFAAATGGH